MYAKLHRIAIRAAICLSALGGVSVANAGYAWPADPAGFVRSGPWGNGYGYAAGANDSTFGKIIHQQNGLKVNVAGRPVTMPVSYRLAQNAPRYAAKALFLHPGVRTAAGIATWLGVAKIVWDEVNKRWVSSDDLVTGAEQSTGIEWSAVNVGTWHKKKEDACYSFRELYLASSRVLIRVSDDLQCIWNNPLGGPGESPSGELRQRNSDCPVGWYHTPGGCLQTPPPKILTQPEFEDLLSPKPMPETVPLELPKPTPLPVEPSPGPWVNPEPGTNPKHRPMFVPTGDPVPNPNYDPNAQPSPENQPFIQPGSKLNPSPAANDPFRIDVKPVDRPKPNETPMPGPEPEADPNENPNDKPKPDERPGLCDEYPDILACAKPELDTPEDEIPKTSKDLSYTPDNLFGGGSCPANKTMSIGGQEMTVWDWDASCGYIQNYMRPVILVLCAFAAFVIVSGGTRQ